MTRGAAPLPYAAPGATRARRWGRRAFFIAWAALTAYLVYEKWGGPIRLQADLLNQQRACLRFEHPPDRVLFEPDPGRVATLLATHGYRAGNALSVTSQGRPAPGAAAVCVRAGSTFDSFRAAMNRVELSRRSSGAPAPPPAMAPLFAGSPSNALPEERFTVFLHRLSAGPGQERLVAVDAQYHSGSGGFSFDATVYIPAGLFGTPAVVQGLTLHRGGTFSTERGWLRQSSPPAPIRLYAPRPDPTDAARFLLDYETAEGRGTVEGRLMPTDSVEMRILSGPADDSERPGAVPPAGPPH
jgi:hypothetical protein